jgi:hypothetical protein|tara:strand:- start:1966 stop:2319 length:354 start_codon:yes stop_codon:yes gene_type:complete
MNIIVAARRKWIQALHNKNMYNILDCYHKNHTFKGTLARKVTYSKNDLNDYFSNLIQMKPSVTFMKSDVKKIDGLYFDSGTYAFTFPSSKQINANYQFVYKVEEGEVKIVSHYSSSI